ncbi:MAG: L,D-transpeptidase [Rhizobiaceae bacterium]
MLKSVKTMLVCAAALSIMSSTLMANERYGQKPPVMVSPDLSAPWVLQLKQGPKRLKQGGIPTGVESVTIIGSPLPRKKLRAPSSQQDFGIIEIEPQGRALPAPLAQQAALTAPQRVTKQQMREIDPIYLPQDVVYEGKEKPGTIVIDTSQRFLYLVQGNGEARRYGVGVGKPGFEWAGRHKITRKTEWPDWRPPAEMRARVKREEGRILPVHMVGGPENPLGARAMYLGSSLYRIHGTNQPWTIGRNVSSGCIRMRNEDVVDLYERVSVGALVIVR